MPPASKGLRTSMLTLQRPESGNGTLLLGAATSAGHFVLESEDLHDVVRVGMCAALYGNAVAEGIGTQA